MKNAKELYNAPAMLIVDIAMDNGILQGSNLDGQAGTQDYDTKTLDIYD